MRALLGIWKRAGLHHGRKTHVGIVSFSYRRRIAGDAQTASTQELPKRSSKAYKRPVAQEEAKAFFQFGPVTTMPEREDRLDFGGLIVPSCRSKARES